MKSSLDANKVRCPWCPPEDSLYMAYHDQEWGVPVRDGPHLFAMLNLEGAQAGLSWRTILGRRENYFRIFEDFDPVRLASWPDAKIAQALLDPGIVRNRLKVKGVIKNARALQTHFDGDLPKFADFLWSFVDHKPIQRVIRGPEDFVVRNDLSDRLAKELKRRDFTFVGSTICYAFMQAVGMINDHTETCFRREPVRKLGSFR